MILSDASMTEGHRGIHQKSISRIPHSSLLADSLTCNQLEYIAAIMDPNGETESWQINVSKLLKMSAETSETTPMV